MVEPSNEENYRSPYVEERFYKKPEPKYIIAEIFRMEHIKRNYEEYLETEGVVAGWSRVVRKCGNRLAFIELNDGSTADSICVVIEGPIPNFEQISKTLPGTSYRVRGKFCKSPSKSDQIEVQVNNPDNHYIKVLGSIEDRGYPLSRSQPSYALTRDYAHLRPRTKFISSITRIRNSLTFATHLFFQSKGFLNIQTPIITASKYSEGSEIFKVTTLLPNQEKSVEQIKLKENTQHIDFQKDFFKTPTFLASSGKLTLEPYACSMCNVYAFNPVFRALYGRTWRHLAEFWMVEPAIAFADLNDAMDLAETYLKFCIQYIFDNNQEDLDYLEKVKVEKDQPLEWTIRENLGLVLNSEFKRITYDEAINLCRTESKEGSYLRWGDSLNLQHERYIADVAFQRPVIIYNYPKEFKPFHTRLNDDNKTVASMEIFIPKLGELIKGSQQEERLDILDQRIEERKIEKDDYWWYRDLRKYGTTPHSGFRLGFERLVMLCTGVGNIRDAIPFPRDHENAQF